MQNDLSSDPKRFWSYLNSKKKISGFPLTMFFNNTQSSSPNDICEQSANFLKSVYVSDKCTSNSCFKNSYVNSNLSICLTLVYWMGYVE